MKTKLLLVVPICIGLAGCAKKGESAPAQPTNAPAQPTNKPAASGNPLTAPVDYLGAVAQAKHVAEKTVDLASVTRTIQLFQESEDRLPKDLNEFVSMKYIQSLPKLPSGMSYAYNPASGEVRAVRR